MVYGAIEAGGTKILFGVGDDNGRILDYRTIITTTPAAAMSSICEFFKRNPVEGIGVGSFGPVDVHLTSPTYGQLTTTPKIPWQQFNWVHHLRERLDVPVYVDTDVNAAALGESRWGAAVGFRNSVYITVGTGVGAGIIAEGRVVHGLIHPEVGHLLVRKHPNDSFEGICPFHQDCLEGLASGPALAERWGVKGEHLAEHGIAWDMEAYYLAQAVVSLMLILSPEKVIMGGGVMNQPQLMPKIRSQVVHLLQGYLCHPQITERIDDYVVPPALGHLAGLKGALALVLERCSSS
ncbi:ROK family protein [Alicyclobacillus kakegawensis]|uniref:ROK family protein n=1 Tax=Alicyclobacillus kakegawensis TaxID=392012 RepID=UPI000832E284|nr:ROK family protein [Alicyclobacillus kakegawensis]